MLFVILFMMVAPSISVEEELEEFEPFPDYYAMLNVSHDASMKEIKRSFRKLAMGYHPDKNKSEGAQMIFQELSEAYSVLGDAQKKAEYDELFKHFYDFPENDDHENQAENSDHDNNSDIDNSEKPAEHESAEDVETKNYRETEEASTSEKVEATSTEKDEATSTEEEDSDEMDDETLFKVLKFLAENDYIITKRTKRTPSNKEEPNSEEESRSKRSADSTNSRTYSEYRTSSQNSSGERGHTGGHHGHDHAWTHSHQHKPRSEHQNARYSNQFHGSEQVYCRTNVRWEGNVKITSKTCL